MIGLEEFLPGEALNTIRQLMHGDPWASHPEYPAEDWQYEVANGDTRRGYWEWLYFKLEEDDNGTE